MSLIEGMANDGPVLFFIIFKLDGIFPTIGVFKLGNFAIVQTL